MVCLVIETPLADDQVGATVLDSLYHVHKLFLLVFPEFVVLFHA